MELEDCAFDSLEGVSIHTQNEDAFKGSDIIVFVGGFPRRKGMLRADLIGKNTTIFATAGKALQKVGKDNVKVLVVANPANTNCNTLRIHCPRIPKENFTCLTRLGLCYTFRVSSIFAVKLDISTLFSNRP